MKLRGSDNRGGIIVKNVYKEHLLTYGYGKTLLLVVLCLLLYCSFNFKYSLFYEPTITTMKLPLVG